MSLVLSPARTIRADMTPQRSVAPPRHTIKAPKGAFLIARGRKMPERPSPARCGRYQRTSSKPGGALRHLNRNPTTRFGGSNPASTAPFVDGFSRRAASAEGATCTGSDKPSRPIESRLRIGAGGGSSVGADFGLSFGL